MQGTGDGGGGLRWGEEGGREETIMTSFNSLSLSLSLFLSSQAETGKECPVSKPQVTSEHGSIWPKCFLLQ